MVKIDTTQDREDEVKEAILEYLYGERTSARSVNSAKVGIMQLRKALKEKGMEQQEVIRNLLYLIETGWVREDVEKNQIKTDRGFFIQTSQKYIISNQGMEFFDQESKFSRPVGLAGINIENVTGVVSIGNNNIIRNESVNLFKALQELENKIRVTDQLNDEDKVNYRAEVKTIESQLSKSDPDKNIIKRSWTVLQGICGIVSLASALNKVRPIIEPMFGS